MTDETHSPPSPSEGDRLDSWKEIAAYLKRDVRTAQRWEQTAGLPVHRHGHRASVYAFRPEIDTWWTNREGDERRVPPSVAARSPWMFWALGTAVFATVVLLSVAFWPESIPTAPIVSVERDWQTLRELTEEADLQPDDFQANARAASNLLMRANNATTAALYTERARRVAPGWGLQHSFLLARTELFPVYEDWFHGDVSTASLAADRLAETLEERGAGERSFLAGHLLSVNLTLGRFEKARDLAQELHPDEVEYGLARIAAANNESGLVRQHLQNWRLQVLQRGEDRALLSSGRWLLLRMGLESGFDRAAPSRAGVLREPLDQLSAGTRAVAAHRYREAISRLEAGLETWLQSNSHGVFENYRALAEARFAVEGAQAAVVVLEEASTWRGRAAVLGNGYFIRNQWWLSQLYRELGRTAEAESLENELLRLLAVADANHHVLVALRARQTDVSVADLPSPRAR